MTTGDTQRPVVVLAAGSSRRFGGANKLLAPFRGRPMLWHTLRIARAIGPVIVVIGQDDGALAALARGAGAHVVENPDHAEGMGRSIAAGVRALAPDSPGAFILPGDMPLVPAAAFAALIAAGAGARDILRPVHRSRPGHPVWFGRTFRDELEALTGDRGAAAVIARHGAHLRPIPMDHPGVIADLDTPEALLKAEGSQASPT